MSARGRGWLLAGLHLALVGSLALKYEVDRRTQPRIWVRSAPYDPDLPIRGRYVQIGIETQLDDSLRLDHEEDSRLGFPTPPARFVVQDGQLRLRADPLGERYTLAETFGSARQDGRPSYRVQRPLAYFIAEHVDDPSRRPEGEELWVEVTIPRRGPPRPIRLGVKRGGTLTPLDLR